MDFTMKLYAAVFRSEVYCAEDRDKLLELHRLFSNEPLAEDNADGWSDEYDLWFFSKRKGIWVPLDWQDVEIIELIVDELKKRDYLLYVDGSVKVRVIDPEKAVKQTSCFKKLLERNYPYEEVFHCYEGLQVEKNGKILSEDESKIVLKGVYDHRKKR